MRIPAAGLAFTSSLRISSAPGEPPGSRVATPAMPGLQRLAKRFDLRGLAGALAAFQGDEAAASLSCPRTSPICRAPCVPKMPARGTALRGIDRHGQAGKSGAVTVRVPTFWPTAIGAFRPGSGFSTRSSCPAWESTCMVTASGLAAVTGTVGCRRPPPAPADNIWLA